jgi:Fe-S-cluster containining protein
MEAREMESATMTPRMQHEVRTHGMNVERVSLRVIRDSGTGPDAMQRAQEMYDNVMQKVDAKYQPTYACKPGCAHCCAAEVTVARPEAELLARHVKDTMMPEQIEGLKARMRAVIEDRKAGGRPRCALLGENNLCTVYSIRPMKCRACNAEDVDPCRRWEEGGDETACMRVFMLPRLYAMLTVAGVLNALTPGRNPRETGETELMQTLLSSL